MVEATSLVVWSRDNIQCHHLHTKFHPNPTVGSKLHLPQKFKRLPFWNDLSYGIE
jgi:hypothetical protein